MKALVKIADPDIYDKLDSNGGFSLLEAACYWNGWYMPGGGQISFKHLPEDVLRFIGAIHDDLGKVAVVIEYTISSQPEQQEYFGIDRQIQDLAAPELDRLFHDSDREEFLRVRVAFDTIANICVFDGMNFANQGLEDYLSSCCDLVERVYGPLASQYIECLGMKSYPEDYTPPMDNPGFHSDYLGPASAKLSNQLVNCILWMTYSPKSRVTRRTLEDYAAHLNQKPMFLFPDERRIIPSNTSSTTNTASSRQRKQIEMILCTYVDDMQINFKYGDKTISCSPTDLGYTNEVTTKNIGWTILQSVAVSKSFKIGIQSRDAKEADKRRKQLKSMEDKVRKLFNNSFNLEIPDPVPLFESEEKGIKTPIFRVAD